MIPIIPPAIPHEIPRVEWQKKGCGVADVAMIVEFYKPNTTTVQEVLEEAIVAGAYVKNVGWSHVGLAALAKKHDLVGRTFDLSKSNKEAAFNQFKNIVTEGPAIASIHRGFDPKSPYGHLIVITGFDKDFIYYNDPGKREGIRKVSVADFNNGGWKKRLIVLRPPEPKIEIAQAR